MSRGLGKMQQAILAALEPAKRAHFEGKLHYRGGASSANFHSEQAEKHLRTRRQQMIHFHGQDRILPDDAYDLRATLAYLSRTTRAGRRISNQLLQDWEVDRRFAISFSRAVRTLINRGELVRLLPSREIRFVATRVSDPR